jgi:hypothetical protein
LVSEAVAIAIWDVGTPTIVDGTQAIADPALVDDADAVVYVVANPVSITVLGARTSADIKRIELVAETVAIPLGNVSAPTIKRSSGAVADTALVKNTHARIEFITNSIGIQIGVAQPATHAQGVKLVSGAVAIPRRNVLASTLVNCPWSVAHPANVVGPHAWIHVVADPVSVAI